MPACAGRTKNAGITADVLSIYQKKFPQVREFIYQRLLF